MRVLGIETSTIVCGVAIIADGRVLSENQIAQKNAHAENIMSLIDESLSAASISLDELDGMCVSIGPGSFTGLRIGLSVAKGLAYSLDKPLIAVSTLEGLAHRSSLCTRSETDSLLLPMIDARRDEVYCQLFRLEGTVLNRLWEERSMTLAEVLRETEGMEITIGGDAVEKFVAFLQASSPEHLRRFCVADQSFCSGSASSIGILGEIQLNKGRVENIAEVEPRYVKEFHTSFTP